MKVEAELLARLRDQPHKRFALILCVSGDLNTASETLARRSVQVRRRFALTNSLSINASGEQAAALAAEPWVESLEEDRPVRAFSRS